MGFFTEQTSISLLHHVTLDRHRPVLFGTHHGTTDGPDIDMAVAKTEWHAGRWTLSSENKRRILPHALRTLVHAQGTQPFRRPHQR